MMIITMRTMPAQLMEWIWTVRSEVTGIQWKAIAAITRDKDYCGRLVPRVEYCRWLGSGLPCL